MISDDYFFILSIKCQETVKILLKNVNLADYRLFLDKVLLHLLVFKATFKRL